MNHDTNFTNIVIFFIKAAGSASGSPRLQPWLTGLTAVVVFLFVVFVFVILKRICGKQREEEEEEVEEDDDEDVKVERF
ncbi:small integral membrane protein 24-like isoform X2 [Corythoichthys intestinalis]|uniref:small integral membrane protein 24-like isoform X2 n=1 Tax=Corythoichthys intestinalis TaxID=161448 RepID=UPI0025A4E33C|nr:small integral membrane protein 24-like isoform X2 [Corythoichthys intestinalis]